MKSRIFGTIALLMLVMLLTMVGSVQAQSLEDITLFGVSPALSLAFIIITTSILVGLFTGNWPALVVSGVLIGTLVVFFFQETLTTVDLVIGASWTAILAGNIELLPIMGVFLSIALTFYYLMILRNLIKFGVLDAPNLPSVK